MILIKDILYYSFILLKDNQVAQIIKISTSQFYVQKKDHQKLWIYPNDISKVLWMPEPIEGSDLYIGTVVKTFDSELKILDCEGIFYKVLKNNRVEYIEKNEIDIFNSEIICDFHSDFYNKIDL